MREPPAGRQVIVDWSNNDEDAGDTLQQQAAWMAAPAPTARASDRLAQGVANQRSTWGEVPKPRRGASARRAITVRSEELEVNRPPRCSQDLCQQLNDRGAPRSPDHLELHAGDPMSKCLYPRLSPSITKVEVLMIRHHVAGKCRPRNFTQSTSAMLSRTSS